MIALDSVERLVVALDERCAVNQSSSPKANTTKTDTIDETSVETNADGAEAETNAGASEASTEADSAEANTINAALVERLDTGSLLCGGPLPGELGRFGFSDSSLAGFGGLGSSSRLVKPVLLCSGKTVRVGLFGFGGLERVESVVVLVDVVDFLEHLGLVLAVPVLLEVLVLLSCGLGERLPVLLERGGTKPILPRLGGGSECGLLPGSLLDLGYLGGLCALGCDLLCCSASEAGEAAVAKAADAASLEIVKVAGFEVFKVAGFETVKVACLEIVEIACLEVVKCAGLKVVECASLELGRGK